MTDTLPSARDLPTDGRQGDVPESARSRIAPLRDILGYAVGDGANSLVQNSIFGFSMLYYTEALKLDYAWAGIAMFVATFWDAISDPLMGHITDNTRSRFGRRHPYMLLGGVLTVLCFYFIWAVPAPFQTPHLLFWYLVVINLLLRTSITIFAVAHGALGFEICTDYTQRATLQGVRIGFNMAVNLAGPAMAWTLFFKDQPGVKSTTVAANYVDMGGVFAVAALVFVLFVVFATRKYIVDTRNSDQITGNSVRDFTRDFKEILLDPYPRTVFAFMAIVMIGMVLVSSLQMYVYVHFMKFPSFHLTIVHGSTMVGCGLGGVISPLLVRRFDKKPTVYVAVLFSVAANIALLLMFVTGFVAPDASHQMPEMIPWVGGSSVPTAMLLFLLGQGLYWCCNGVFCPIAGSMMADVSEICEYRTGIRKDGGYSAMLSFISKASLSAGLLICGYVLKGIGFDVEADTQTPVAIKRLAATTFLSGAGLALIAMLTLARYPVTREYMATIKKALASKSDHTG